MIGIRILLGWLLMAASNGVAWHMVVKSSKVSLSALRLQVRKIALFYTLWAMYNRFVDGRTRELGAMSFGILLVCCWGTAYLDAKGRPILTRILLIWSSSLVALNYAMVLPMLVIYGGPFALAKNIWVEDEMSLLVQTWALVFAAYMVSNVVLWSYCCYLFSKLPLSSGGGGDLGYTRPTIQTIEYRPVRTAEV